VIDWFAILWLSGVALVAAFQMTYLVRGLRTGIATAYFHHDFPRAEDPFKFWMIIAGRAIGVAAALAMFAFGFVFFGRFS
jgi:hypothetical protein